MTALLAETGRARSKSKFNQSLKVMKKENTYMTVKIKGLHWSECQQVFIGCITWPEAVNMAKAQSNQVRLCTSPGYNNQGHYIQPDKYYTQV